MSEASVVGVNVSQRAEVMGRELWVEKMREELY